MKKKIIIFLTIAFAIFLGLCIATFIIHLISNARFDSALSDLKHDVRETYAGRNSIEVKDHTVTVKLWSDKMSVAAMKAYEGDSFYLNEWNAFRDQMHNLVDSVCDDFDFVGDFEIYFIYANEQNPDRNLLVFRNRELYYDVVSGFDARGG